MFIWKKSDSVYQELTDGAPEVNKISYEDLQKKNEDLQERWLAVMSENKILRNNLNKKQEKIVYLSKKGIGLAKKLLQKNLSAQTQQFKISDKTTVPLSAENPQLLDLDKQYQLKYQQHKTQIIHLNREHEQEKQHFKTTLIQLNQQYGNKAEFLQKKIKKYQNKTKFLESRYNTQILKQENELNQQKLETYKLQGRLDDLKEKANTLLQNIDDKNLVEIKQFLQYITKMSD